MKAHEYVQIYIINKVIFQVYLKKISYKYIQYSRIYGWSMKTCYKKGVCGE